MSLIYFRNFLIRSSCIKNIRGVSIVERITGDLSSPSKYIKISFRDNSDSLYTKRQNLYISKEEELNEILRELNKKSS